MRLLFHQIHKNKHFECVPAATAAAAVTTLLPTPIIDVCYHIDAVAVAIVRIDVSRRCVLLCDIVCTQRVNTTNE